MKPARLAIALLIANEFRGVVSVALTVAGWLHAMKR